MSPNPLTHQSLKCVIEYLEAKKRIDFISQCGALQKIEKTIPLHADFIKFDYSSITIDNLIYCSEPGNNPENGDLIKELSSFISGRKGILRVNQLEINVGNERLRQLIEVLKGVKLQIRKLKIDPNQIELLLPIVADESFPLKEIRMLLYLPESSIIQLPIVQTAQKLKFDYCSLMMLNVALTELSNREIEFMFFRLRPLSLLWFVQNLLKKGGEIGTCYTFKCHKMHFLLISFPQLIGRIGEQYNRKLTEYQNYSTDPSKITFSISLPMSSTTELFIEGYTSDSSNEIKIQIVPQKASNPLMALFSSIILWICNIFGLF